MRRSWILMAVGLLVAVLAIGAVACDDDEDGGDGDAPTATAEDGAEPPTATSEPAGEEPTATEEATNGDGGEPTVIVTDNPDFGGILTDAEGNTLYTFAEDGPGVSNCQTDPCPQTWPPLTITGDPIAGDGVPGELGITERDDGTMQVTHNGAPLYYFANDTAPGDTNGQGIGGRWFVVEIE